MTPQTSGRFFALATYTTDRARKLLLASSVAATTLLAACGSGGGGGHAARLLSIAVTPPNPSIAAGTTRQFTATGTYSNAQTMDITGLATWSSSDTAAALVSNAAGSAGLASGVAAGSSTISAALGGLSGATSLTVSSASLTSIEVTPTNPSIALGTSVRFTATGVFTDGSTQDLSAQVLWDSSDLALASFSSVAGEEGLASGVGVGSATVSASLSGVAGSTSLAVTSAVLVAVQVTPTDPSIALGTDLAFAATGLFSDGTKQDLTDAAAWSASSSAASVSNGAPGSGLAHAAALGSATITATVSGQSGSSLLTITPAALVSIAVTPANPSIALGTQQPFTAMGTFTDATVQDMTAAVAWSSSDEAFASVSNADGSRGIASSVGVGSATITATSGTVSGSTMLTVTPAVLVSIDVTPVAPSIALGYAQSFQATGIYSDGSTQDLTGEVTWSSSSASVAAVSNADGSRGLATSTGVGSSSIAAALDGISGSTALAVTSAVLVSIEVSPDAQDLPKGFVQTYTALGIFSDGTREDLTAEVTWASSDESVAKISNAADSPGIAKGVGVGTATISASLGGLGGSAVLDVTSAVLVSIDVTPYAATMAKGTSVQFIAVGTYSDESAQDLSSAVAWSSSDPAVAFVSNAAGSHGVAFGFDVGSATITASLSGFSGTADVTVSAAVLDSIVVTPANATVPAGLAQPYTAVGVFSDASTQDITGRVTWSSSAPSIAAISNAAGSKGLATALAGGMTTISATAGGISGSTSLAVTVVTLDSIDVSPDVATVPSGYSIRLSATGNYSDGSSRDLTREVIWTSSASSRASVSNAAGTEGRVSGSGAGSAVVSATLAGVVGSASITVTNESLVAIDVDPTPVTLAVGETQQLVATGTFSGGSVLDVTAQVRWSSNNKFKISVGNSASKGLVTAKAAGSATIKAKKINRTGTASVTAL